MLQNSEPPGPYITQGAAAYPTEMNRMAAEELVRAAALARTERTQSFPPRHTFLLCTRHSRFVRSFR